MPVPNLIFRFKHTPPPWRRVDELTIVADSPFEPSISRLLPYDHSVLIADLRPSLLPHDPISLREGIANARLLVESACMLELLDRVFRRLGAGPLSFDDRNDIVEKIRTVLDRLDYQAIPEIG